MKLSLRVILSVLAIGFFLVSCKKKQEDIPSPPVKQRSYLKVIQTATGYVNLDILYDTYTADTKMITDLGNHEVWPEIKYADLDEAGKVDEFNIGALYFTAREFQTYDTVMLPTQVELVARNYQTLFLVDSLWYLKPVFVTDVFERIAGQASIRFANLNVFVDGATLNVLTTSSSIGSARSFKQLTDFQNLNLGTYDFEIKDNSGNVLVNMPGIPLDNKGVYTIYLHHDWGAPAAKIVREQ